MPLTLEQTSAVTTAQITGISIDPEEMTVRIACAYKDATGKSLYNTENTYPIVNEDGTINAAPNVDIPLLYGVLKKQCYWMLEQSGVTGSVS